MVPDRRLWLGTSRWRDDGAAGISAQLRAVDHRLRAHCRDRPDLPEPDKPERGWPAPGYQPHLQGLRAWLLQRDLHSAERRRRAERLGREYDQGPGALGL